ncbi:hypothetical protein SDJN02_16998, partial [Cucurbita argyrosperma subsp. argyrosperma]
MERVFGTHWRKPADLQWMFSQDVFLYFSRCKFLEFLQHRTPFSLFVRYPCEFSSSLRLGYRRMESIQNALEETGGSAMDVFTRRFSLLLSMQISGIFAASNSVFLVRTLSVRVFIFVMQQHQSLNISAKGKRTESCTPSWMAVDEEITEHPMTTIYGGRRSWLHMSTNKGRNLMLQVMKLKQSYCSNCRHSRHTR